MSACPTPARIIYRDIACDREQPGLERTSDLVGVARFENSHEHFLIDVLEFLGIRDTPFQEIGQRRADTIKELPACIGVALLQLLHQPSSQAALLRTLI